MGLMILESEDGMLKMFTLCDPFLNVFLVKLKTY